ncbi:MAG: hypothetical protein GX223_03955, partial [Tepidanaerobacter sp.]|nr:hypothetical protein [Tepidanaerobacter sp.]
DLSGVGHDLTQSIRKIVEENSDIKGKNIMITASHTHSGPAASRMEGNYSWMNIKGSEIDEAYYTLLRENIARAILWANNELEEVAIGTGKGSLVGLGSNRQDPNKPFDHEVNVLRVDSKRGDQPIAVIVNYPCHPTVLSAENYLISGDFPSYMAKGISRFFPGCEAMFMQGAAGDISTRHNRRESTFKEAKRMGEMLAGEVIKVMNQMCMTDEIDLTSFLLPLQIPVREFEADEVCVKKIEDAKKALRRLQEEGAPENIVRTAIVNLQGAERYYVLKQSLNFREFNTEMQLFKLGKTAIVAVPAELFNKIGQEIKSLSCKYNVIVAGYANDYVGYVLDAESYGEDSYEAGVSMVHKDAEKIIVNTAKELISMIR